MARKQILGYQGFFYKENGSLEAFENMDVKQISKARKHMESIINGNMKPDNFLVHVNEISYYEIFAKVKTETFYDLQFVETVKVK